MSNVLHTNVPNTFKPVLYSYSRRGYSYSTSAGQYGYPMPNAVISIKVLSTVDYFSNPTFCPTKGAPALGSVTAFSKFQ